MATISIPFGVLPEKYEWRLLTIRCRRDVSDGLCPELKR